MLSKGIIFLLVWLLFISRLIPKYYAFQETNQVHLFGHVWEEGQGIIILLVIAAIAIVLLGLSIQNFYLFFSKSNKNSD